MTPMTTKIDQIPILNREQWLGARKDDVTASVVGALFGVHPYTTALKEYLRHSGIEFDEADNEVTRRGRILEPAVAAAVAELRPEWTLKKATNYYREPANRLGATPDYLIQGDPRGPGVLQAKTAAPHVWERDWQNGEAVPFWIQLQCLTEAMLTEAAFGVVAALQIHAFDLACCIIEVPRHPPAEQKIRAAVAQFWCDVADGREPEPNYGRDADLLRFIAPREQAGKVIDLGGDNELPALLEQREMLMAEISGREQRKVEIEAEVKFKMRDAERVAGLRGWSITWKTHHVKEHIVKAKDQRPLRIHHNTNEVA